MGLLLTCGHDAVPGAGAPFLLCTYELTVSAVSETGERIYGGEDGVVGTPLLDLVTSPLGDDQLARHVQAAAQRPSAPVVMPLRLAFAGAPNLGTLTGRIATCEPPRAALVAVEPSGFGLR